MKCSFLSRTRRLVLAVAILAPGFPAAAAAQAPTAAPTADAVIARYVEAIGGRQALESMQASRTVGTFEMPAAGVRGDLEVVTARPNLNHTSISIPGLGTITSGFDGTTAWSVNPMTGPRVLTGTERAQTVEQGEFDAMYRDPRLFQSIEMLGTREVDGETCHEIRFVWNSGRESRDCFSENTGLIIQSISSVESPMGSMEITNRMDDYREFNGVRFPTRVSQSVMGQEQIMTITGVEFEPIAQDAFTPPAEIQAIVAPGS
jgi:hypothetical protein